jgi:hypothetical protein
LDFFGRVAEQGYPAFKIKVGHADPEWDLHRLELLNRAVGPKRHVMVDANEAWSPKEALTRVQAMQAAGHRLLWVEDPILRDDFEGLRLLRQAMTGTQLNSGEYLDLSGRRALLEARATDMLNVHGRISEVMQVGWLAADIGIPVTLGNTFWRSGSRPRWRCRGAVAGVFVPELRPPGRGADGDPRWLGHRTRPARPWPAAERGGTARPRCPRLLTEAELPPAVPCGRLGEAVHT